MKPANALLVTAVIAALSVGARSQTNPAWSDSTTSGISSALGAGFDRAVSDDSSVEVESVSTQAEGHSAVSARRDGLWFSTADEATQLHVHGYIQADDRMFTSSTHGEELDAFLFRRIRPLFEGTLFNAIDFRFMPDFGQSVQQIQEAFLEEKTFSFAKLRVGKFKEPIGLEVLRSDRELIFAERSMASDLVPLRYLGAQLSGSVLSDSIAYEGGFFQGSSDGANGVFSQWTSSHEAVARLFLRPFAVTPVNPLHQFGFGVAGSAGDQEGAIAGLKTVGQTTFFKYSSATVADGQHNRLSPQAYYYLGPFGVLSEYVMSSQELLNKKYAGRVRNQAWETTASFMLTGEKNSYAGVRPRNASEHVTSWRRFGAVELAARYSQLAIDGDAFPHFASVSSSARLAKEQGIGLNWYLNRYVKLVTDFEHTNFTMAPGNTKPL
ncbi:MAG TPA: porin, partial [Terriglobales bacterium]|nr:porin [Terriglobales bacterium]